MRVIAANRSQVYSFPPGVRASLAFMLSGNYDVITGHVPYGVHALSMRKARYVTILRDPLERCISAYYFAQEWSGHPAYQDATSQTIAEFYRNPKYQNDQTKFIGGHLLLRRLNLPVGYYLRTAKARLRDQYTFGIVENYKALVALICKSLGWQEQPIIQSRHARLRPTSEKIPAAVAREITELNLADCELYQFAQQLFDQRCQNSGISFVADSTANHLQL